MEALADAGFGASQPGLGFCSANAQLCGRDQGLGLWESGLLTPTCGPLESPLSAMVCGSPGHSARQQQVLTKQPPLLGPR